MNEESMTAVDEFLFELCCTRWQSSEQQALENLQDQLSRQLRPVVTMEHVAVFALMNYQALALPTPRQHIHRMIRTFCPDQCTNLVEKLDGASESQQLEVLAGLQKQYGLVLGNDVAMTVEPMQLLLLRNRSLTVENDALKQQIAEQRNARDYAASHHELIEHLYRCTATIDVLKKDNDQLKLRLADRGDEADVNTVRRAATATTVTSVDEDSEVWEARSEALHQRIAALVSEQIEERTAHGAAIRELRKELDRQRKATLESATNAATLAEKLATFEATRNGMLVKCATCAAKSLDTVAVQTVAPQDDEPCLNEQCIALNAKVQQLTARLCAATEALQRRL